MKKLMIAAFAVCAAVAANAAAFTWMSGDKCYGANVDLTNLAVGYYGVDAKNKVNPMNDGKIAYTAVMVLSNSLGDSETLNNITLSTGDFKLGKFNKALSSDVVTKAEQGEPNVRVDFSIIITGTYTDANLDTWTFTSDEIKGFNEYGSMANLNLMTDAPAGWTVTGGPSPIDTPEPTSGLLLLLGVAGLALRRRRA